MSKIFCPLLGASFQTQLIVMTLVDTICSLRDWTPPFDWAARIDRIWKTTISPNKINGKYDQYIKIALSWVVVSRMVVAHLYTITHVANLYTILTWWRGKVLIPWLMLSAFKNFFLESIVILVVILLYIEGNLSGFLFMSIMTDKLISFAVAAHNWFTINSFYSELEKRSLRKSNSLYNFSNTSLSPNIMLGISMQNTRSDDDDDMLDHFVYKPYTCSSLPNLDRLDINLDTELREGSSEFDSTRSISIHNEANETQHYLNNYEDSEVISTKNAIEVLKSSINDINENSEHIEPEIGTKTLGDSIAIIKPTESEINDDDDVDKSTLCDCPTSENPTAAVKVASNEKYSTADNQSTVNEDGMNIKVISGNHSKWVNQWSLNQLLRCTRSQSSEEDNETSRPLIFEDSVSRWSSDEDLDTTEDSIADLNSKNGVENSGEDFTVYFLPDLSFAQIKNIDYYEQSSESWIEQLKLIVNSFGTLQNHMNNNSNKINDGSKEEKTGVVVGMNTDVIKKGAKCSPANQNILGGSQLKSPMQMTFDKSTEVNIDNNKPLYESSAIQTSSHELTPKPSKYYYYKALSMYNSSNNQFHGYETAHERERRELKALKAYNARTLWKDKRKKDIEEFIMHDQESNLLSKTQSLKSNNENQLCKRKQRHQSKNTIGAKKVLGNSKMNSVSCKKIQVTQVGQHLNRVKARENIHSRYLIKILPEPTTVDYTADKYCSNKVVPKANSQLASIFHDEFIIKNQIAQLDWTLSPEEPYVDYNTTLNKWSINTELGMSDVIDENNTADLLRSAFSFDIHNTERGFYLGPASTDLYSLSEQIPNVFHEIIKAARFRSIIIDRSNSSKMEIDFGESYYEELTTIGGDDKLMKTVEYSNNSESLNNHQRLEIDCWIEKLMKLLSNCGKSDQDLQKIVQLTKMPEYFILKQVVNNLGNSPMVSVSTTTSRPSLIAAQSANTSTVTKNNE